MTGPATLTDRQLAALRTYATPAALAYHDTQVPEASRVDLPTSFLVHGDLKLVAADMLEAACLHARSHPASAPTAALKKIKVGPIELERSVVTAVAGDQVSAAAWCDRAARLRQEATSRAGPLRSPLAGLRSGSDPRPVFAVTRDRGGQ